MFQSRSSSAEVEVIEVFSASDGPSALLVHHASEGSRSTFGEWLRAHDGAGITCRLRDGTMVAGRIFRMKMCFGRGLILTLAPVTARAKDRMSLKLIWIRMPKQSVGRRPCNASAYSVSV
jgi:hypothetical protein